MAHFKFVSRRDKELESNSPQSGQDFNWELRATKYGSVRSGLKDDQTPDFDDLKLVKKNL